MPDRIALAWSSGKDSAWTLFKLQQNPQYEVVVLLTTLNAEQNNVISHGISAQLLACQAAAVNLPLHQVFLRSPCANEIYNEIMTQACAQLINNYQVSHIAFGDLYLEDVRSYREHSLQGSGLKPLFPLWGSNTATLAREMVDSGLRAYLSCVDITRLPAYLAGRKFDHELLDSLPSHIDPCGENGEFHTFVSAAPFFSKAISVFVNGVQDKDQLAFANMTTTDNV
ncbi:hypothetical protein [Nitrosomonas communis]|uniref:MJ0570-related uncharacterized domain-containing protein n=1 Tax=Nitrosomonas communis TaxID=44574 RepID=A0A1H2YWI0_9PROT|nr:hypothetical protein [Nitrosomonas communis]SDX09560.1 MJ0570-related uncharacterized domain-containing protein [Nitrosomonas communis]